VSLDPVRGREQAGTRPAVVISVDLFNQGPAGLVIVVPMTTTDRRIPLHVAVDPPEGGLKQRSFVQIDNVRSISSERLIRRWGTLEAKTLVEVERRLRMLLRL
jgi:mRNA interferase MazF